ncbi:hypothetical protein E2C01_073557 [Portunus trituberculatus]|uniref:Secreted protein n=1 Tax=Portunus trituberculatus TaxID=210409 RepID=A0A5B7IA13_PORTR|nr:hypothetical protein [Portunus trituberculatus]
MLISFILIFISYLASCVLSSLSCIDFNSPSQENVKKRQTGADSLGAAVVHACFGVRGVSKRMGSNPVHGSSHYFPPVDPFLSFAPLSSHIALYSFSIPFSHYIHP